MEELVTAGNHRKRPERTEEEAEGAQNGTEAFPKGITAALGSAPAKVTK